VLGYDGKPLTSPAALQAAEENTCGKEEVVLHVRRGEETLTLMVPLGKLGIQVHPDLPPIALTLYEEGRAAQKAQKPDDVIAKWTMAAKAAQEAGDTAAAAWLYGRVGEIHEGQRQWKEASEAYAAAWERLNQSRDAAARSRTLLALGRCSQSLNDFRRRSDGMRKHSRWTRQRGTRCGRLVASTIWASSLGSAATWWRHRITSAAPSPFVSGWPPTRRPWPPASAIWGSSPGRAVIWRRRKIITRLL